MKPQTMKRWIVSILAVCGAISASLCHAAEVGAQAPAFSLKDTRGTVHTLESARGKFLVLEWLNFDCPFVRKHYGTGNMQALQKKLTGQGALWFSVVSSASGKQGAYAPSELDRRRQEQGAAPTALLIDADGAMGRAYGAKTTPHMYVIDPQGKLVYEGAIDDKPSARPQDVPGARNLVLAAFEEAKSGKPVSTPYVAPYGCSVKY